MLTAKQHRFHEFPVFDPRCHSNSSLVRFRLESHFYTEVSIWLFLDSLF